VLPFFPGGGGPSASIAALATFAIALAPYSYAATLVFGVPAFLVYQRFHRVRFVDYLVGGFVGPVVFFVVFGAAIHPATPSDWLGAGVWFGLMTAPATAVFWLIAVRPPRV
jgi:hypothetical protein